MSLREEIEGLMTEEAVLRRIDALDKRQDDQSLRLDTLGQDNRDRCREISQLWEKCQDSLLRIEALELGSHVVDDPDELVDRHMETNHNHRGLDIETHNSAHDHGPSYYRGQKIQPWDVIDEFGLDFYSGCVVKYILRAGKKGPKLEDLAKAKHYIEKLIEKESTE